MSDAEIISETPITMAELKEEFKSIKKRDKELNFRANRTEEYLNNFDTVKNSESAYGAIEKLGVPRLKDVHIKKMIDLMPSTDEEMKVILQGYTITVTNENINKILDTLNKIKEPR